MKKFFFYILAVVLLSAVLTPNVWAFQTAGEEMVTSQSTFKTTSEVVPPAPKPVIRTIYVAVPPKADTAEYTIVKGDTLDKIAKSYDIKREVLLALNPHITDANKIYAGKKLTVPVPYAETKLGKLEAANKRLAVENEKLANANVNITTANDKLAEENKGLATGKVTLAAQVNSIREQLSKEAAEKNKLQNYIDKAEYRIASLESDLKSAKGVAAALLNNQKVAEAKVAGLESSRNSYAWVIGLSGAVAALLILVIILQAARISGYKKATARLKSETTTHLAQLKKERLTFQIGGRRFAFYHRIADGHYSTYPFYNGSEPEFVQKRETLKDRLKKYIKPYIKGEDVPVVREAINKKILVELEPLSEEESQQPMANAA